jgi:hypothetical protein
MNLGRIALSDLHLLNFVFINLNYSRRQASGLMFEVILPKWRQIFTNSPIPVMGELSKPQTWNNSPIKQAFSILTPAHRE